MSLEPNGTTTWNRTLSHGGKMLLLMLLLLLLLLSLLTLLCYFWHVHFAAEYNYPICYYN